MRYKAVRQMTVRESMSISATGSEIIKVGEEFDVVKVHEDGSIYGELEDGKFVILKFGSSADSAVKVSGDEDDTLELDVEELEDELEDAELGTADVAAVEELEAFEAVVGEKIATALNKAGILIPSNQTDEELLAIDGIGPASVEKINEAMAKLEEAKL